MMGDRKARRLHKQRNEGGENADEEARRVAKINKRRSSRKKKHRVRVQNLHLLT